MIEYHIVYKATEDDLYSTGTDIKAENPIDALKQFFFEYSVKELTPPIFMCMYVKGIKIG